MGYIIKPIHMSKETKGKMRLQAIKASLEKMEESKMKKIERCPHCRVISPPLTLRLQNPHLYENANVVPDTRTYEVICLNCNKAVESSIVDNTLIGVKKLRDAMNTLYGKSRIIPPKLRIWSER